MGIFLSRSSPQRVEEKKSKWRKNKRKPIQSNIKTLTTGDQFLIPNNHNRKASDDDLINSYEDWNTRGDKQNIKNYNVDPPGAPSTFSNSYSMSQTDVMNQTWQTHHNVNNQFYSLDSRPTFTKPNFSYDSNLYGINQSQTIISEERPSKKVQFAQQIQQQPSSSRAPLTNTQSWHEQSGSSNETSASMTRHELPSNKTSVNRPLMSTINISSPQLGPEKPIYVGIDHRATLAERGQQKASKHHHKSNTEASNSNTNGHRTRSHTHHHKNQDSNDPSNSKVNGQSNKIIESIQLKPSNPHRQLITTSTSTSTAAPLKSVDYAVEPILIENETKIAKTRHLHGISSQQPEQQLAARSQIKSIRSTTGHSQPRQKTHESTNRNNSPMMIRPTRRHENKQESASPVMRVSLTRQEHQRQKPTQFSLPPIANNSSNVTRTRV